MANLGEGLVTGCHKRYIKVSDKSYHMTVLLQLVRA